MLLDPCSVSHVIRSFNAISSCMHCAQRMTLSTTCSFHADVLCIPIGNALMRNRQPFKLRRFSVVHNAVLFSLSLYMCIECIRQSHRNFGWGHRFQLWCNPNDGGRSPSSGFSDSGRALANVLWVHYVSKVR